MPDAFIVEAVRTPVGKRGGAMSAQPPVGVASRIPSSGQAHRGSQEISSSGLRTPHEPAATAGPPRPTSRPDAHAARLTSHSTTPRPRQRSRSTEVPTTLAQFPTIRKTSADAVVGPYVTFIRDTG